MKIGLVCPYNLFKGGGVQECVAALRSELSSRGHEALIITPQPREYDGPVPEYVRLLGRSTDVKSPFHTTAQVSVSVDPKQVDTLLETEHFDILHFHEPWVPLLSRQLLLRSQAKNIATFHAKLPETIMAKTIERVITPYTSSLLKYLDVLTAVSAPAASYVQSLTDDPITIIPNGIDLTKYNVPKNGINKAYTILYIGRLERRKGLKYLIKAVKELQILRPNVTLIIAGDGPDRQQLEQFSNDLGVKAEFLGRIDEATKLDLLKTASVFCSPARYGESFGIVLLEAMACGLPVVAGDNPGYSSVLTDTGRLSLVDPRDSKEFAQRLDLFIFDEGLRKLWQTWAEKNIKQYSYKNIVDSYESIYGKA